VTAANSTEGISLSELAALAAVDASTLRPIFSRFAYWSGGVVPDRVARLITAAARVAFGGAVPESLTADEGRVVAGLADELRSPRKSTVQIGDFVTLPDKTSGKVVALTYDGFILEDGDGLAIESAVINPENGQPIGE
jgi:hypothetical protein